MSYMFVNGKILERTAEEENLHNSEMGTLVEDQDITVEEQIEALQQMIAALQIK